MSIQIADTKTDIYTNTYRGIELLDYFLHATRSAPIPTGFPALDENLNGGLTEGLYFLGAISSLGKTTLALQIADQIADQGQDVIFFSLEMSKYELVAKSLSRWTYIMNQHTQKKLLAKETTKLLYDDYSKYSFEETRTIQEAIERYKTTAKHISFFDGRYKRKRLSVEHIKEIVDRHTNVNGNRPVVFIDYLQIIAPADARASDKRNIDTAVFELKGLSRDYHIPVIVISSFNRQSYDDPVTMKSFKESGAIEYSSDVLLGLQYSGMDYQIGETDAKRKNRLQTIFDEVYWAKKNKGMVDLDLKCLKNRHGCQFTVKLLMCSAFNYFTESDREKPVSNGSSFFGEKFEVR